MKRLRFMLCVAVLVTMSFVGCGKASNDMNDAKQDATSNENQIAESDNEKPEEEESLNVRVASLKGPTSLGMLQMMNAAKEGKLSNQYEFNIVQAADEIVTKVVKGEIDVALVPANVASVLYQKTEKKVEVIDINTLGVLYVVEHGDSIQSVKDLAGKTICMTGKGQVPEYALSYILGKHEMSMEDVTVEFKSEPAEVISFLETKEDAVGIIPMPFASAATMKDSSLRLALNLTDEWNKVDDTSTLITGVTIARKEFVEQHQKAIDRFLEEHVKSVEYVNANVEEAAAWAEESDIVKAPVAMNAIPYCNLVAISGDEMKTKLSGYLQTLFDANPQSVGGTLPDEGFYYESTTK